MFSLPRSLLLLSLLAPALVLADGVDGKEDADKAGLSISADEGLVIGTRERVEGVKSGWHGAVGLGWDANTGDTNTRDFNASFQLKKINAVWLHQLKFEAAKSEEDNITSEELYTLRAKSQYFVTHNRYYFGDGRYEKDLFSGKEYEAAILGGHGWRVLEREALELDLELATGLLRSKSSLTQLTHDEWVVRTAGALFWRISPSATLNEELGIEFSHDDIRTESLSELKLKVGGGFSMKLTFLFQHDNEVPEDIQKVNTRSTASLVYEF